MVFFRVSPLLVELLPHMPSTQADQFLFSFASDVAMKAIPISKICPVFMYRSNLNFLIASSNL